MTLGNDIPAKREQCFKKLLGEDIITFATRNGLRVPRAQCNLMYEIGRQFICDPYVIEAMASGVKRQKVLASGSTQTEVAGKMEIEINVHVQRFCGRLLLPPPSSWWQRRVGSKDAKPP